MLGMVCVAVVAVLWVPVHTAQPVICRVDAHCSSGSYCETNAHICQECLSCEDLKREPSLALSTCIKTVAECGACVKGLVLDRHGDVNAECVPPDTSQIEGTPSYVYILISVGVLLFLALVVGIIVYLLRYPEIFKTSGSNQSSTVTARITATAPEAPPPYNPLPQLPYHSPPYLVEDPTAFNEDEQFIKRSPSARPQGAPESAGSQAARVYDKPVYERDLPPPSPESPEPEYTDTMTLPIHDEDTMPSPWMPAGPANKGDVNVNVVAEGDASGSVEASGALPALLSAARDTTLLEHSAPKRRRLPQDPLNSRTACGDNNQNSFPRSPSPTQGHSFITQINVVQINNTK